MGTFLFTSHFFSRFTIDIALFFKLPIIMIAVIIASLDIVTTSTSSGQNTKLKMTEQPKLMYVS